jgi:hypothetical protein
VHVPLIEKKDFDRRRGEQQKSYNNKRNDKAQTLQNAFIFMFNSYNPIGTIRIHHHRIIRQSSQQDTIMNHQSNPHQEWEGTTAVERQGLLKERLRTAASSLSRIMPHRQSWTNRWKDSDCDKSSKTKRLVKSLIVKVRPTFVA